MNIQGQEAPYFCLITNYNATWLSESDTGVKYKQEQSFTQPATHQKTQWGTTKAKRRSQHNLHTNSFSSRKKKKTLAMQYSTSQMVNWRLWSRVPTRVVGCTCIQQGLEGLHHNAHVWSKISFILHAQCSNCCKLFEGCKETNSISIQWQVWVDKKLMKKIKQHATALISHLNIALCTI